MRIAIDMTALLPQATGVDVYIVNLVRALSTLDRSNRYFLIMNTADQSSFRGQLPDNFSILPICFRPRIFRLLVQQVIIPILAVVLRLDVVHSPAFIIPLTGVSSRHFLTVHDMTSFSLPEHHNALRRNWAYRNLALLSMRRANGICVPSRHVANEVLRLVPAIPTQKIRVIHHGIGIEFQPQPLAGVRAVAEELGIGHPYILHVGTLEPRKNLSVLVSSYWRLVRDDDIPEHLVLAGRIGWGYKDFLRFLNKSELRDRVQLLGYVQQRHLAALYSGARLFVYPSIEEGFGFPPLEAMACGVPVIASLSSSLTENLKGAADLVPFDDETAIAQAMKRNLEDESHRNQLIRLGKERAATFHWEDSARKTLGCYEELAKT